jgi:hypothetical protein
MNRIIYFFLAISTFCAAFSQTEFSQENATQLLKTLCIDIGPRPMGSPAERKALQFAVEKFKEYGCDTAYIMEMPYSTRSNTTSGIAIGVKRGAAKRIILVGGHIDSAGPEIPGADDDGSGAAAVMEAARVLCKRPMESTLMFCCWGGEEQGLEGSKYFVEHYADLDSIDMMLQADMANGIEKIDLDPDTHGASAPAWLVKAAFEEFYSLGYEHLGYATHFYSLNYAAKEGAGSDHESFLRKGIPAIDFTTDVTKPIHTPRDNFENFDPRGLKRTGDVIVRLVNRFDGDIPSREVDQYWLYVVGSTPIFIPFPLLWAFVGIAVVLALIAFVVIRRRREPPDSPNRVQWSGMKMWLFSIVIVVCGWFSSDLVGLLRGIRHPWMTAIPMYYVLAAVASGIGVWFSLRMTQKLHLSHCPYVFFKRAAIILIIFLILLGFANVKLMVEPAVGLLLISLAVLIRNPLLKLFFWALSPWWMLRLVFSEWGALFFRGAAMALPAEIPTWLMFNGVMILFLSLFILPFLFAAAAVVRDTPQISSFIPRIRSIGVLSILTTVFVIFAGYLMSQPVYDNLWYRDLRVEQRYDMNRNKKDIIIKSGEYLSDLNINYGGNTTHVNSRATELTLTPTAVFDTTMLSVDRQVQKTQSGDARIFKVDLTLRATQRPYIVSVTYNAGKDKLTSFDTHWKFRNDAGLCTISWYSFPDSVLKIPVEFEVTGSDSVRENIEVTFARLAEPMSIEGELTYLIPRTRYNTSYIYK